VALGISAVFAPSVLLGRDLLSEPLFVMLMLMAVAAALDCRHASAGWRRPLLAGVLCGLAVLTRSAGLTLVPCIAFLVWNGRPRLTRRALIAPAIVLAAAMLTVAPWTVRNALVMHRFIPVTDQGGYTLAGVYNRSAEHDQLTPWLWRSPQEDPQNRRIMDSANAKEAAISSQLGTAAVRFLGDHPTAVLGVLLWNSIRLADLDPGREQAAIAYDFHVDRRWARLAVILLLVTGALAVAGALLRAARTAPIAFWLIPLTFWLSTAAIQSGMRFRSPIDPFLIMLTSLALTSGWTRWTAPSERPAEGDR
jgi:4-amino-4-deoxy-L-arabinose transferase-like glycosyltransferase